MIIMAKVLCVLSCLLVMVTGEATPDIQLAGFDDLFKLATGSVISRADAMQDRADRSLTNTFPFNQVNTQSTQHHASREISISPPGSASSHHTQAQHGASVIAARAPVVQTSSIGSSLFRNSAADINSQAHSTYSNIKAQAGGPASSFHFDFQSPTQVNPGFTLLTGLGTQANPRAQYNIGAEQQVQNINFAAAQSPATPVSAPSYSAALSPAPAYTVQAPAPVHSTVTQFANFPPVAPAYALQDYHQEIEVPNIKVIDNAVIAVRRRLTRPATGFVNPNRRRNPAQRRRKPAGQTFEGVAAAGQRCIDKIEQVEEIEFDEVEECNHSYDKKCHTSYSTEYESQQEEECDDNYKKDCDITYSSQAHNVTVRVCMTPLVKDCNIPGPEVCRTEYISECWTKNDPHIVEDDVPRCRTEYEEKCVEKQSGYVTEEECSKWPREVCTVTRELKTKLNPVTRCEKVPQELCGPSGCGFVPGGEECQDAVKTIVTDIPTEVCDLQPQRKCSHVTKLVPKLTPVEECVDVPKEICQRKKGNPRTVLKPVTKTWCYTPTEESGLA